MTSINLDKDTLEKLSIAVYACSISQAELLKEAINTICHDDARLAQAIEKSRSEIARGEFFTQEQVEADNQRLRQEILARKCG